MAGAGHDQVMDIPMQTDPKAAIDAIMSERAQLKAQVQQLQALTDSFREEIAAKDARLEKMEPYEDIIDERQTTVTCYIRDDALVTVVKLKLREVYGALADFGKREEGGQFAGARLMDHLVEEALWYGLKIKWHELKLRLEIDRYASGQA